VKQAGPTLWNLSGAETFYFDQTLINPLFEVYRSNFDKANEYLAYFPDDQLVSELKALYVEVRKSYIKGKPAAYYLTPQGARALTKYGNRRPDEPINMKRIYKEKDVTENFIEHCKNLLDIYLALRALYSKQGKLSYFTRSQLSYEKYDSFPSPLQDAYVHLKTSKDDQHFFLDIFEDSQPFFVLIRRIKKYLDYAGSGDWVTYSDELPTILLVVQYKSVHKRLRKRIAYELRESYEELAFATTRLEHLLNSDFKGKVWLPVDEDEDDSDEPVEPLVLARVP
jgi:hypothetical protein